jgi:hypothetical protein
MSCAKCKDLSSAKAHPVKDFAGSLRCPYCNKMRFDKIKFLFLIFIIPFLIYFLTTELDSFWFVVISYWIMLGYIMILKSKKKTK